MSMRQSIEKKIKTLSPDFLEVIDESYMHNVPEGAESHFKVTVVSQQFNNLSKVARHREIYGLLAEELAATVHALALHLYSPKEWASIMQAPDSPNCLGGSAAEKN